MSFDITRYPYTAVLYMESTISGSDFRESAVVIGPHTILTASHCVYDANTGQSASNLRFFSGYSNPTVSPEAVGASSLNIGQYRFHYFQVGNSDGTISVSDSQYDYAVIDFANSVSYLGSFGLMANYGGGAVHVTGYPVHPDGNPGSAPSYQMFDNTGSVHPDPTYTVLDNQNIVFNKGNSGGPVWLNDAAGPEVVGLVSSATGVNGAGGRFAELTNSKISQITSWEAADSSLWGGSTSPPPTVVSPPPPPSILSPPAVSVSPPPGVVEVYRLRDPVSGDYFYTANPSEVLTAQTQYAQVYEGAAFKAAPSGDLKVARYLNLSAGGHLYSASSSEQQSIAASHPELKLEGSVFAADSSQVAGTAPVWRFQNTATGRYLLTGSQSEYASILANYPQWRLQGPAFYEPT